MKKLLSLLLILYSFSASSEIEYRELMAGGLDMSLSDFCIYQPGIQNRGIPIGNFFFLMRRRELQKLVYVYTKMNMVK